MDIQPKKLLLGDWNIVGRLASWLVGWLVDLEWKKLFNCFTKVLLFFKSMMYMFFKFKISRAKFFLI